MQPANEFQELMRNWTSLGPYNALHLMRVAGPADVSRWETATGQPLRDLGLQPPRGLAKSGTELVSSIREELNEPFKPGDLPMRFFVVEEGKDDTHYFGITFDHWVADSQSIRFLMKRIFANYSAPGVPSTLPPVRMCEKPFQELFGRVNPLSATLDCVQNYFHHMRAYRIPIHAPLDFSAGFQYFELPDGLIQRIREAGKKIGASVNDVFLAAAAQTLGQFTAPDRSKSGVHSLLPRRNRVGFSAAVDIRSLASQPLDDQFGFFLSYYTVLLENPESDALPDLASRIAARTRAMKSTKHTLRLFQSFKIAIRFWNYYKKPWQRAMMLHRSIPMLGSTSNVNLTDSWIGRDARVLDYIRVSPTGPLTPLVFTLTTIHQKLSLCVTHRNAVFSDDQALAIARDFIQRLVSF